MIGAHLFMVIVTQPAKHLDSNRMNWYTISKLERLAYVFRQSSVPEDELGMKRDFAGLKVNVENPAGTDRCGVNDKGKEWRTKMKYDYGFVYSIKGIDGDALDVYLGPDQEAEKVYIVHQVVPETGKFDEDKCMLGFESEDRAKEVYLDHYDSPEYFGSMSVIPFNEFKKIVENGDREKINWKKRAKRVKV